MARARLSAAIVPSVDGSIGASITVSGPASAIAAPRRAPPPPPPPRCWCRPAPASLRSAGAAGCGGGGDGTGGGGAACGEESVIGRSTSSVLELPPALASAESENCASPCGVGGRSSGGGSGDDEGG